MKYNNQYKISMAMRNMDSKQKKEFWFKLRMRHGADLKQQHVADALPDVKY